MIFTHSVRRPTDYHFERHPIPIPENSMAFFWLLQNHNRFQLQFCIRFLSGPVSRSGAWLFLSPLPYVAKERWNLWLLQPLAPSLITPTFQKSQVCKTYYIRRLSVNTFSSKNDKNLHRPLLTRVALFYGYNWFFNGNTKLKSVRSSNPVNRSRHHLVWQ